MKKLLTLFLTAVFACSSLCACSTEETPPASSESGQNVKMPEGAKDGEISSESKELRFLCDPGRSACNTENGYYYLPEMISRLQDGESATHLMYMDFASGSEIYLCSTAGCKHDSPDCPSVFLDEEFPVSSTRLFIFGDSLYILSREYDQDGTVSMEVTGGEGNTIESKPAVLYRAALDGTKREKVYTFDPALTLEDLVIGDDKGIYLITKKISADKTGNQTYTTSSERKLMFLNLASLSFDEVGSMSFDDHISWQVTGCFQNQLVLSGTDYGRELSREEMWDDDLYKELYTNSQTVYAVLELNGGKPKEFFRVPNRCDHSEKLLGDCLYLSSEENLSIEALHIATGERKTLCTLSQNLIMDTLGDKLCCRAWNLAGDPTWYFVDTKTGEVSSTPLIIPCNGWSIDFCGETESDVLFIYDYDAEKGADDSYEIFQYKHALIAKDDLFSGKKNFRKIKMTGRGQ